MDPLLLLSLAGFVALAILSLLVIRRASRVLTETREAETFRRSTVDLADRAERSLAGVSARIDLVRRHQLEAPAITENLVAAIDAVERYVTEARALRPPLELGPQHEAIVAELLRARRALGMAEHGCTVLATASRGPRELEAQTSIKRGYLNILHAREALGRHAADVAASRLGMDGTRRRAARDHTM